MLANTRCWLVQENVPQAKLSGKDVFEQHATITICRLTVTATDQQIENVLSISIFRD
jgi:hypothetical protein